MKKKTAAIYNRWWYRQGGGELHALSLVPVLEELGYDVSLLSPLPLSFEGLRKSFPLLTSTVKLRQISSVPDFNLATVMPTFDLFINASHLEVPSFRAKKGISLVYFPTPLDNTLPEKIKRSLLQKLSTQLLFVQHTVIQEREILFTFSRQKARFFLTFFFPTLTSSALEQIQFKAKAPFSASVHRIRLRQNTVSYEVSLTAGRDEGLTITYPENISPPTLPQITPLSWRGFLWQILAQYSSRLAARLRGGATNGIADRLKKYDVILANSQFTQKWIQIYWQRNSIVLYPPVEQLGYDKQKKEKSIVVLGRFFAGGHNKKQAELVQAFASFHKRFPEWRLHVAGRVGSETLHQEYFSMVQKQAKDLPVTFYPDAQRETVVQLLQKATVFWQATGYNENLDQNPEKAEHFGIALTEAMSAGCVCFAHKSGGASEIITEENGVLWSSLDELVEKTGQIVTDLERIHKFAENAEKKAQEYSSQAFKLHWREILKSG